MDFRHALSAGLPPPSDDDPPGLRQNIVDELADHLASSTQRELLRGLDPVAARAEVLKRFGDPAGIARRLWLDAMKGKIMAQRAVLATCLLVTAISLAIAGMFWMQSTQATRELAETNRRMAEALLQNQAANRELMSGLEGISKGAKTPEISEWIPVSFKLTQGALDGPPVVGCKVWLTPGSDPYPYGNIDSRKRIPDANGKVDFGVAKPGDWSLLILQEADDGANTWVAIELLNILPGSKVSRSIVCPKSPAACLPGQISVDWPSDLRDKNLAIVAGFEHAGMTFEDRLKWTFQPNHVGPELQDVVCETKSGLARIADAENFYLWRQGPKWVKSPVHVNVKTKSGRNGPPSVELVEGDYQLKRLLVMRPASIPGESHKGEQFDLIAHTQLNLQFSPVVRVDAEASLAGGESESLADLVATKSYWQRMEQHFQIRSGGRNEWKIALPDELIHAVREKLKSQTAETKN